MPLQGHNILIVDPDIDGFVNDLQRLLGDAGADTLVTRDLPTARRRSETFEFTAVVARSDLSEIKDHVTLPTLLYGTRGAERNAGAVVRRLKRRLSAS
ncbi:MAG: hypothetical protein K2X43_00270 [Hyphomonadaceae bacterium]|nr:hypothetical protein [Hyphomonadaceae bacterium]